MERRFAWALNFDAEDELASPRTYAGPKPAVRARFAALASRLGGLVAPDDVVLDRDDDGDARGLLGRAWCPTPRALARLGAAGASVPRAPSIDVLRAANDRKLAASLGPTLPGAAYVETADALERALADGDGTWLLKRALSFAGRGRRKVFARALTSDDRAWIAASLRLGGLQVEPFVERIGDYALHGELDESGQWQLGQLTVQRCDAHGAWIATELAPADDPAPDVRAAIALRAEAAARALAAVGYFGPFGVDAYTWRDERGALRLNPCSDVNARYTMGWAIGMRSRARRGV